MRITILGAGNIGLAAGTKWKAKGHDITFGVRDPQSQKAWNAISIGAKVTTFQESMVDAEVVLVAIPLAWPMKCLKASMLNGKEKS